MGQVHAYVGLHFVGSGVRSTIMLNNCVVACTHSILSSRLQMVNACLPCMLTKHCLACLQLHEHGKNHSQLANDI